MGRLIELMGKLEHLEVTWNCDIHQLLMICGKLKELTIRIELTKQGYFQQTSRFERALDSWLDEWIIKGFLPQTLNITIGQTIPFTKLIKCWLQLNPQSPAGFTGCLKIFSTLKFPMALLPTLPFVQLQFGQSCSLPFVKPSKCGLLGLEDILLTDSSYCGKVLHKARMMVLGSDVDRSKFTSGVSDLSCVTHFDCRSLCSGHLKQLAKACPNLQHLNLSHNHHCLESLQGLHAVSVCCKNLKGLNLMGISVVENCVQLWKLLVDMKLTYMAIESSVLVPWESDRQAEPEIIMSFQKFLNLKSLEIRTNEYCCSSCSAGLRDLSALSHFPSLVHCFVEFVSFDVEIIVSSRPYESTTSLPDTFLQSISGHGGLVHAVLCTGELSAEGITSLVENSPKLLTCHIYANNIKSSSTGATLGVKDLSLSLKKKFCGRKLFTFGSFYLSRSRDRFPAMNNVLVERHMDITSLWPAVIVK